MSCSNMNNPTAHPARRSIWAMGGHRNGRLGSGEGALATTSDRHRELGGSADYRRLRGWAFGGRIESPTLLVTPAHTVGVMASRPEWIVPQRGVAFAYRPPALEEAGALPTTTSTFAGVVSRSRPNRRQFERGRVPASRVAVTLAP
jgi:hypothetical protein